MGVNKGLYRSGIGIIFLLSFLISAWGAAADEPSITSARIGAKELMRQSEVTVIKEDLTRDREVLIVGQAQGGGPQVEKVEVSLDNGQTWKEAAGRERWQYQFAPLPNYTYYLTLRVTNADGVVSDPKRFGTTRLTYLPITLTELIQQQADELARAYMSKNLERYMGLISRDYQSMPPGWHRLRRAIENDFRSLNNITLRFTVNQVFNLKGTIMADIHWRLTYAGLLEPKEGYVEIHFDPADHLKIILQRKDLYFGSVIIGHNGSVLVTSVFGPPAFEFTVTDLDKIGATFVSVRVRFVSGGVVQFDGNVTLTETPPRSGTFTGSRTFSAFPALSTITATYIDEITSDWRRNLRRTDTFP
ncbi:MAG: hypothetical protein A2Y65_00695 [Deltaproteobacteria bacterium RBG_13_52_11]|nr:MAG: hypothetical protein A2Y65_00695 [Deltaproteobacteria bacterium RBG_13_52_11]